MSESPLAPYVPAILRDRLAASSAAAPTADGWRLPGVCLVIDITGFTALTERLASRPDGAEALAAALNDAFGGVLAAIAAHGGDVVNFAGDAVLAVWPQPSEATVRAAALAGLGGLASLEDRPSREPETRIRARAGIALGDLWAGVVGGAGGEWRWVVGGRPMGDAGRAAAKAQPGSLVMTSEPAALGGLAGTPVGDDLEHLVVESAPGTSAQVHETGEPRPSPSEGLLAGFVPKEVVARLEGGITGWLAEFRRLSVVFVGIVGLDPEHRGALARAQRAFLATQSAIERLDGSLSQIVDDDKGLTIVAAWGMPDRTHEDDPARAVLAGRAIADALAGLGLRTHIGITTGRVFTGIRGNDWRREYAMVGDVVNLAARLMQSSADEVRCDAATARAAAPRLAAQGLAATPVGALTVKGHAAPVETFAVAAREASPSQVTEAQAGPDGRRVERAMIGRELEWATLRGRLARLADSGRGGFVVVEGEPGVGKSELLGRLAADVPGAVRLHAGAADAIERSTAFYAWRRPLLEVLDAASADPAAVSAAVAARVAHDPALLERAPLLEAIVPMERRTNAFLEGLTADVRADAIRDLVVELLAGAAASAPRVIVLEDVHWLDSSSWALLLAVVRRVPGILVVASTRPMGTDAPPELGRALAEPGADRLVLGPLPQAATEALVAQALGVGALPAGLGRFIEERAEGNPFFSQQLAFALRDAGHLVIADGSARLTLPAGGFASLDVPDSVQGVLASRIDRLSPSEQLTLKVASVIGRLFQVAILREIHPLPASRPTVATELDRPTSLDLTRLEQPAPDLAYLFTHVITQEVAYDLLVFAQRRPLHRAVAEWYEANVPDLEPLVPLLAHHWTRAGDTARALEYLGRAGEQSLRTYANAEALGFLERARALDDEAGRPTAPATRADWERWTGIALVKETRYREALVHFEACLALLGAPNPGNPVRRILSIWRHLGLQAVRRLRHRPLGDADRERALAISECHRYLAEVWYWRNDVPPMVHAMVASLNHAEPAGDSKELVFAFATVGFLFGLLQLHRINRAYRRLTNAAAARVGNPDASGYAAELEGVYGLVVADWDATREVATRGIAIFNEIGDRMRWHTCHSHIGYADLHQGRFISAAANAHEAVTALGPEGAIQSRIWSLSAVLACDMAADRLDLAVVEELAGLLGPAVHHSDVILAQGLIALARTRAGDGEAALALARDVLPMFAGFPPPSFHTMLGIEGALEVLIERWAAAPGNRAARKEVARGMSSFRMFARFNHAARPRVALFDGQAQRIGGNVLKAREAWDRARKSARKLDMPYEHALADVELAASYPEGSPERRAAVDCALADLQGTGAERALARAKALLPASDGGRAPVSPVATSSPAAGPEADPGVATNPGSQPSEPPVELGAR